MSITLFCLVKGNTLANAFSIKISKDEYISELKKVIKEEKQNDFAGVDANKLKLRKVEIPDDRDDLLSNLPLQGQDVLLATRKISKYFPGSPVEEHIHVLVESPASTATSSREQELLEKVASLQELINKSAHGIVEFDVVVRPKWKANKWTVNIEQASLKDFRSEEHTSELQSP